MAHHSEVSPLRIRERQPIAAAPDKLPKVQEWSETAKVPRSQSLLKNLAVSSALVLCAVTLRTGALPSLTDEADIVLTAATDQSLLDDQLGKLSFVSALFPEAVLVFGESQAQELTMPVNGGVVVHAWSEGEPYLAMRTSSAVVNSASAGEVIGVYHGNGDERLVQVISDDGLACLYGNLDDVAVSTGNWVASGQKLGNLLPGEDLVFEVRMDGRSIDPSTFFSR